MKKYLNLQKSIKLKRLLLEKTYILFGLFFLQKVVKFNKL